MAQSACAYCIRFRTPGRLAPVVRSGAENTYSTTPARTIMETMQAVLTINVKTLMCVADRRATGCYFRECELGSSRPLDQCQSSAPSRVSLLVPHITGTDSRYSLPVIRVVRQLVSHVGITLVHCCAMATAAAGDITTHATVSPSPVGES